MKKIVFWGLLIFGLGTWGIVKAFDIPKPEGYVLDQANILSSEQEISLEEKIAEFDQSRTVEVGILTVKTLDGEDISSVTVDVANKWGVGKKDVNNGVMILIAVDDRDWFIASGYGVEGSLPDAILKRIGEKDFPDNFRAGNYYQGLTDVLRDMEGYLAGDDSVVSKLSEEGNNVDGELDNWQVWYLVIMFFVMFIKSFFLMKDKGFWLKMLVMNFIFFVFTWLLLDISFAVIMGFISVFLDVLIWAAAHSKGGGSSYSGGSGSGWSSGGSSSFGGGGGSSFGGGSFGGGGSGGKW